MFAVPIQRVVFNNFLKVWATWCLMFESSFDLHIGRSTLYKDYIPL